MAKSMLCGLAFLALVARRSVLSVELGFHSDAVVDQILEGDAGKLAEVEVPALPFHFRVPLDGDGAFDDIQLSLIDLSDPEPAPEKEGGKKKKKGEDAPVQCETICKRMGDDEAAAMLLDAAQAKAQNDEIEAPDEEAPDTANQAEGDEEEMDTTAPTELLEEGRREGFISMAELGRTICHAKGGSWDHSAGNCAPFMQSTKKAIQHDGESIFKTCKEELGAGYVPCSPYQALALAHMYDVPDHMYFWLWAGGRHDQSNGEAMKQGIGNNPASGLDKCPEDQHVGFFHNWNEAHVDSWGCLHKSQKIPVLCCRQN